MHLKSPTPVGQIVMEDFKIYPWMANKLSFDPVPSCRVIGCVETGARRRGVPIRYQMAQHAKEIMKDSVLEQMFNIKARNHSKHGMDAMRHAVFFAFEKVTNKK
jgi:hypothetical protein